MGYVRCSSFQLLFGDGNLHEVMRKLASCDGLIVDVRSNGGGLLTAAEKLASLFVNEPITGAYICHKTGTGHNDFSAPQPITIEPIVGFRWQKPMAVLTHRRTYSAAELPNGWSVRFSACPMFTRDMQQTELGIEPNVKVDIAPADYAQGIDTIIETARRLLKEKTLLNYNK